MLDWVKARLVERTTLDGVALILACGSVILFGGLAKLLAWVGSLNTQKARLLNY